MRRIRTGVAVLAGVAGLSTMVAVSPASAVAVEEGYCATVPSIVDHPDGSFDITNESATGEMVAGCVTTHHVSGVSNSFAAAYTYPGWTYKVKDAGGVGKDKVSVAFTHLASGLKITYVIQPGRVDWRVS